VTAMALDQPFVLTPVSAGRRVLSRREAARYCGVSESSLDRAVRRGDLPAPIRIGRRTLWRAESLDAALNRLAASN
jgi:excisionase family DNA binding protein